MVPCRFTLSRTKKYLLNEFWELVKLKLNGLSPSPSPSQQHCNSRTQTKILAFNRGSHFTNTKNFKQMQAVFFYFRKSIEVVFSFARKAVLLGGCLECTQREVWQ